jgi:hypothetical protein
MKAKLIKLNVGVGYKLNDENGNLMATTLTGSKTKLSFKNCQSIEFGYDLDLIKLEFIENNLKGLSVEDRLTYHSFTQSDSETYVLGFQRAIEYFKNKR